MILSMKKFEIKTRLMNQSNGALKVRVSVKNGWKFWNDFYLKNDGYGYGYVKSDEFKEFLNSIFSKYEGMTYDEMLPIWKTDNDGDKKMIGEKLDKYAYYNEEEPFKVLFDVKLQRRYRNGFKYKIIFANNKDKAYCWFNRFFESDIETVRYFCYDYCDETVKKQRIQDLLVELEYRLKANADFMNKLNSYKNWGEVWVKEYNAIDKELKDIVDKVVEGFNTLQQKVAA